MDNQNIWTPAEYLIKYINNSKKVDENFIDLLSNLLADAISDAKNNFDNSKLEKISTFVQKMKKNELNE